MAKQRFSFVPYPATDDDVLLDHALTSLPSSYVTSYPASGTKGDFTTDGYSGSGLGGTGRLGITGLPNQADLQHAGFISFNIETVSVAKDDSLDAGQVTQSVGVLRGSNGCLVSCWGSTGNNERLQLYMHSNGTLNLYKFGTGAQTIIGAGITSVGKAAKCHLVWAIYGKLHIIYINGAEIGRGTMTGNYDTNQFSQLYLCGNGAFADSPFGNYRVSDLQIGLRPPDPPRLHKNIVIWNDSFVESGFGSLGSSPTYGVRQYDARMDLVVKSKFMRERGIKVKIRGFGYSGYSWSNSFPTNPQTNNQATIKTENPEILIMSNSVNGVAGTTSLVADYQASMESHIDYVAANCSNLKKIAFVSMFPFSNNPANAAAKTNGVTEASNAVFAALPAYVAANYPSIEAYYFDAFSALGGHDYPNEWTYGYIAGTDDLHPSPLGHYHFGNYWHSVISELLNDHHTP